MILSAKGYCGLRNGKVVPVDLFLVNADRTFTPMRLDLDGRALVEVEGLDRILTWDDYFDTCSARRPAIVPTPESKTDQL